MFMGSVIVGDDVDGEIARGLFIDGFEEGQPLLMAMARRQAGDQLALEIVERGKQGQGTVPHVIMGLGTNMPDPQWQTWLGALQRLTLGFLVAAQHQRLVRWVEIQPDDVPELLFKALVVRQFEGAREMRPDVTGRPQALHAGRRDPGGAGYRAAAPSPQMGRWHHRLLDHLLHRRLRQPWLAPAPGTIA